MHEFEPIDPWEELLRITASMRRFMQDATNAIEATIPEDRRPLPIIQLDDEEPEATG